MAGKSATVASRIRKSTTTSPLAERQSSAAGPAARTSYRGMLASLVPHGGVDHGRGDVLVPQAFWHRADGGAGFPPVRRERVAERMARRPLGDAPAAHRLPALAPHRPRVHVAAEPVPTPAPFHRAGRPVSSTGAYDLPIARGLNAARCSQ